MGSALSSCQICQSHSHSRERQDEEIELGDSTHNIWEQSSALNTFQGISQMQLSVLKNNINGNCNSTTTIPMNYKDSNGNNPADKIMSFSDLNILVEHSNFQQGQQSTSIKENSEITRRSQAQQRGCKSSFSNGSYNYISSPKNQKNSLLDLQLIQTDYKKQQQSLYTLPLPQFNVRVTSGQQKPKTRFASADEDQ